MPSNSELILYASDKGTDTLTFKHGTGNLSCSGGADITLSQGYVKCFYDGTTVYVQPSGLTATAIAGLHGYALNGATANSAALVDDATLYAGLSSRGPSAQYNFHRVSVPFTGTITRAYVRYDTTTPGSNETSTVSIRLNDTTDTTISTDVTNDATTSEVSNTALNIAVTAGDTFVIKWVGPTWATNPGSARINWVVWVTI
jgi:hypothetical protein